VDEKGARAAGAAAGVAAVDVGCAEGCWCAAQPAMVAPSNAARTRFIVKDSTGLLRRA
jgi:hypothetical protein